MLSTESVCLHASNCRVCGPTQVLTHEAGLAIRGWAKGIATLVGVARQEDDEEKRETILAAIEGVAWAIGQRGELDVDGIAQWRPRPSLVVGASSPGDPDPEPAAG